MAFTQTDLDAIDRAILAQELEVDVDGSRVKYRSVGEMIKARQHIEGLVMRNSSPTQRRATRYFNFRTSRE